MSDRKMLDIYGNPSYKRQEGSEIYYTYYGSGRYNWHYLSFTAKNGIISKISIGIVD